MLKNKYIIGSVIAVSLMFTGINSFAATGKVNTETVKMRAKASTDSKIVMLVSINDKVEIIEKSGDWYKVKFDGNTGYIYAKYVDTNEKVDEKKTDNAQQEVPKEQTSENTNNTVEQNSQENVSSSVNQENSSNATNQENQVNTNDNKETPNVEQKEDENIIAVNSQILIIEDTDVKLIPLINSSNIATLKANTSVTVIEYVNGWYYVISSDTQGWVRKEKLDSLKQVEKPQNNENTTAPEQNEEQTKPQDVVNEEDKPKPQTEVTKFVNTQKVNVRKKASTDSSVIKQITVNTKVTVLSTENGWSKIKIDDEEGFVSAEFLSDEKVEQTDTQSNKDKEENDKKTTNRSLETSRKEIVNNASNKGESVVSYAKTFLGKKYVYGGTGPNSFDCSGFTAYVYKNFDVSLAHSASAQANVGIKVEKSNLQLGDLVIFNGESNKSIGHVGIYIGGNNFIHASNPKGGVKITSLSMSYYATRYVTGRRVF